MVATRSGPCGVLAVFPVEPVRSFAAEAARPLHPEPKELIVQEISLKFEHVEMSTVPLVRTFT